ncbi:hypothetical protein TNCV_1440451 [Trichonephila clavipes]|nr:hypothetical protein TNCV_1440451 [Trichonephila clavipes]
MQDIAPIALTVPHCQTCLQWCRHIRLSHTLKQRKGYWRWTSIESHDDSDAPPDKTGYRSPGFIFQVKSWLYVQHHDGHICVWRH